MLPSTIQDIEKAFLQNNPKILYSLFSSRSSINISLPEPISFSDQLSHQQAYFLFKRTFSSYATFEFYSESKLPASPEIRNFIFKARWSFKDKKTNNQYVFHIFFYLMDEASKKSEKLKSNWKIIEIKAERRF
ncbi:MAG: hypothetical protein JSV96_12620 [Candidatus Aminicenantes bacterium]|nr:MAG: hypothetical protein JSV96_12620 [Candidatus Aminicenantes bacterium]